VVYGEPNCLRRDGERQRGSGWGSDSNLIAVDRDGRRIIRRPGAAAADGAPIQRDPTGRIQRRPGQGVVRAAGVVLRRRDLHQGI